MLIPKLWQAKEEKADVVCLPEMFVCPYETPNFPGVYAEKEGGPVSAALSDAAKKFRIYLSAGSVPELGDDGGATHNTAYVFDREGLPRSPSTGRSISSRST